MAVDIKLKRSSVPGKIPTISSLELGEIALNTYDGKAYMKKQVGSIQSIVEIGSGSGGSTVSASYALNAGTANNATTSSYSLIAANATSASYVAGVVYISGSQTVEGAKTFNTNTFFTRHLVLEGSGSNNYSLNFRQPTGSLFYYGDGYTSIGASGIYDLRFNFGQTGGNYKQIVFHVGNLTLNTVRSFQFPDKNGTLLIDDITTGSVATASLALSAVTASYFSGSISNAISASYASASVSASYASSSTSASYAATASYAGNFTVAGTLTAQTLVVQVITSSQELVTGSLIVSGSLNAYGGVTGSLLGTASWADNAISASYASFSTSASYASSSTSASYALFATSASYASSSTSASYASSSTSASYADVAVSASYALNTTSASYASSSTSASYADNSTSASYAVNATSASFASAIADNLNITASNILVNNNLVVNGTASFNYVQTVTGSAIIIGEEYIILNTQQPAARFAGLQIYDSGSNSTASVVWDSERNHLVYQNASGASYSGGGFMSGPRNTGSLGDETYPTLNRILRGQGGDHLYNSNISDNDTKVSIFINTEVTGGLIVTAGITGSLQGTASWADNATTASYALIATSASYASSSTSASYASASTSASYASASTSASYASASTSASYASNADLLDGLDSTVFTLTSSFQNYTSSNDARVNALDAFSSSILSFTSSANTRLSALEVATASLYAFSSSILNFTSSTNASISALNAQTASLLNFTSSTNAAIASIYNATSSLQAATASLYAFSASILNFTSSYRTGSFTGSFTGSLLGTASFANNATTSSYALNAAQAQTASYVLNAVSASYSQNSTSASYALNATSASYAVNAGAAQTATSASFATQANSAFTASSADNFTVRGTLTAQTIVVQTITSSISVVTGSMTVSGALTVLGGITGSLFGTASWANNATTSSYALTATSASFASTANSAPLYLPLAGGTMTGDITFTDDQEGIVWSRNSDGASIRFYNTGNGDTDSRLEFNTLDDNNEYFRWTHSPSGGSLYESMRLVANSANNAVLTVSGKIIANSLSGSLFGTASWATNALSAISSSYSATSSNAAFSITASHALSLKGITNNNVPLGNGNGSVDSSLIYQSSGNVGINTTAPESILHVVKSSSAGLGAQLILDNNASSAAGNAVEISFLTDAGASGTGTRNARIRAVNDNAGNGAANMQFWTWNGSADAERVRIANDGNVGIGTSSPSQKLEVNGNIKLTGGGFVYGDGANSDLGLSNNNGSILRYGSVYIKALAASIKLIATSEEISLQNNSGTIWMNAGGNVGIGTTSPSQKLDVVGNVRTTGELIVSGSTATIYNPSDGPAVLNLYTFYTGGPQLWNGRIISDYYGQAYTSSIYHGMSFVGGRASLDHFRWFDSSYNELMTLRATGNLLLGGGTNPSENYWRLYVVGSTSGSIYVASGVSYFGGNVGVGTTSPLLGKLQVNGNVYATSFTGSLLGTASFATSASHAQTVAGGTANYIPIWSTNSTLGSSIIYQNTNAIGINTTSPTGSNMSSLLHVNGAAAVLRVGPYYSAGGDRDFIELIANGSDTKVTSPNERFWIENTSGSIIINASANVGIGTTSPSQKLEIQGDILIENGSDTVSKLIISNGGGGNAEIIGSEDDGILRIKNGNIFVPVIYFLNSADSAMMTINNGNVGINTTSPAYKLDVVGEARITGSVIGNQGGLVVGGGFGTTTLSNTQNVTAGAVIGTYFGAFAFIDLASQTGAGSWIDFSSGSGDDYQGRIRYNNGSQRMDFYTNASSTPLVSYTSANVGIGTTSPSAKLDIAGSITVGTGVTGANTDIKISNATNSKTHFIFSDVSSGELGIEAGSSAGIKFNTNTFNTRMVITSGGNVGIGTTSPSAPLEVYNAPGASLLTALRLTNGTGAGGANVQIFLSAAGNNGGVRLRAEAPGSNHNDFSLYVTNAGTLQSTPAIFVQGSSNNVGIGTTSPSLATLQVNGNVYATSFTGSLSGTASFANNATTASHALSLKGISNNYVPLGNTAGDVSNSVIYQTGGNIGIGTTSPSATLTISKAASNYVFDIQNADETEFKLRTYNHGTATAPGLAFTQGLYYITQENAAIKFYRGNGTTGGFLTFTTNNGTEQVRITNGGNVGIGTTSPVATLDTVSAVTGTYASSTQQVVARFYNLPASLGSGNNSAFLSLQTSADGGNANPIARIGVVGESYGSNNGAFVVATRDGSGVSERMRITSEGNVGIGTTSPGYKLDVVGTGRFTNNASNEVLYGMSSNTGGTVLRLQNTSTGGDSWRFYSTGQDNGEGAGHLLFNNVDGVKMIIKSDGNVGINITTPSALLTIKAAGSDGNQIYIVQSNDNRGWRFRAKTDGHFYLQSSYTGTDTERFMIRYDNGNVGIGTTAPAYRLEVNGPAAFGTTTRTEIGNAASDPPGAGVNYGIFHQSGLGLALASGAGGSTQGTTFWNISGSTWFRSMTITGLTGNVGIGNTNPNYKLDVNGSFNLGSNAYINYTATYPYTITVANTAGVGDIVLNAGAGSSGYESKINLQGGTSGYLQFSVASSEAMRITSGGNVGIGNTTPSFPLEVNLNSNSATTYPLSVTNNNNQAGDGYGAGIKFSTSNPSLGGNEANKWSSIEAFDVNNFGSNSGLSFTVSNAYTKIKAMVINRSGGVGIGTTSPGYKLEVAGTVGIGGNTIPIANNTYTLGGGSNKWSQIWGARFFADDGSAGSPSYTFAGDQDSGFFKPGDGALAITINGVERMRIDGGNVGIGTTSPAFKLQVKSTGAGDIAQFTGDQGFDGANRVYITNDAYVYGRTNLVLTGRLDASNDGFSFGTNCRNSIVFNTNLGGAQGATGTAKYSIQLEGNSGTLYFQSSGSSAASRTGIAFTQDSNVGIGNTAPADKLDVSGNISIGSTNKLYNGSAADSAGLFFSSNAVNISGYSGINFRASTTNIPDQSIRMVITNTGNVGIGTTSPLSKLDVYSSTATATAPTVFLSQNAGYGQIAALDTYHGLTLRGYPTVKDDYTTSAADVMSFFEYGGDFRFYKKNVSALTLQGRLNDGTWTVTGDVVAYGSPSDITLKTNIKPLEGALEKIMQLKGVSFTWKEDTETNQITGIKDDIGFIAQEVQEVLPEMVRKNENGLLSLRDKGITALLVEAIKEQQRQIDDLKYLLQTINK